MWYTLDLCWASGPKHMTQCNLFLYCHFCYLANDHHMIAASKSASVITALWTSVSPESFYHVLLYNVRCMLSAPWCLSIFEKQVCTFCSTYSLYSSCVFCIRCIIFVKHFIMLFLGEDDEIIIFTEPFRTTPGGTGATASETVLYREKCKFIIALQ